MSENLDSILSIQSNNAFYYTEQVFTSKIMHFYITRIDEPELYGDMFAKMMMASESDVIVIHLNTWGGYLSTGMQIITSMRNTAAHVVTIVEGECHSMGTAIFLCGDEKIINEDALMMFHNFIGPSMSGKGNEQIVQIRSTIAWFEKAMKKIYVPFLSEEEFARILKGEDIWMDTDEIRGRLERIMEEDADVSEDEDTDEN